MNRLSVASLAVLTASAVLLTAAPASAYCRALAKNKSGVCDQTCSGNTLVYWDTRNFKWELFKNPASATIQGNLAWADVQAALQRSAQSWQDISCSDLKFEFTSSTPEFKTGFTQCATNTNRIVFREKSCAEAGVVPPGDTCLTKGGCGQTYDCWDHDSSPEGPIALTTTTFDNETGQIVDGDMEFNASNSATTNKPVNRFIVAGSGTTTCDPLLDPGTDIENTATHEFGHFLGLAHSLDVDATMYVSAKACETTKRDLAQDDINAICAIYPKGGATAFCKAPIANPCPEPPKKGMCSAVGGADILALTVLAAALRRRRFQRKNL